MPRFIKGQSGNPRGRPKGSRNLATLFAEEVQKPSARAEGRSKLEAVITTQVAKAEDGDARAMAAVLDRFDRMEAKFDARETFPFSEADREVIAEIHRRLVPET